MNWPWNSKDSFGDIVEQQLESSKISSELLWSGILQRGQDPHGFNVPPEKVGREAFIIERECGGKTDQHLFILYPNAERIDWYHRRDFGGPSLWLRALETRQSINELTRILQKHWDFLPHL